MKDELMMLYEEELMVLENLLILAEEEGRSDLYISRAKEYNKVREERDYYASLHA